MSYSDKLNKLSIEIVDKLTEIDEFPAELFPHLVYVEEVNGRGAPEYVPYRLISIEPYTGYCKLKLDDGFDNEEERHQLAEINYEWLITIWERYLELAGSNAPKEEETVNSRIEELANQAFKMPLFFIFAFDVLQGVLKNSSDEHLYEIFGKEMHADSVRKGVDMICDRLNFRDQYPENNHPYIPKKYQAFIYPTYKEYANLTDKELIRQWEKQGENNGQIQKVTIEEFNQKIHDPNFTHTYYWARIICC